METNVPRLIVYYNTILFESHILCIVILEMLTYDFIMKYDIIVHNVVTNEDEVVQESVSVYMFAFFWGLVSSPSRLLRWLTIWQNIRGGIRMSLIH